ncbi:MAG: hypothetical protein ACLGHN_07670 [Bacteriovoracia bacterium]
MNKFVTLFIPLSLVFLASCQDVSSNRRQGQNRSPERSNPELGTEGRDEVRSQLHREKGSPVLSYAEEISKTLSNDLSDRLYRIIPDMDKDDEGSFRNVITMNDLGRPNVNCGLGSAFSGIDARITDCFQKNGNRSIWEGEKYGAAGEGLWKLVSLNGTGKEIWFDGRTGMVWSYIRTNSESENLVNWCQASGNDENQTNTATVDCNDLAEGESLCAREVLSEVGTQVKWRLPTRNDYLQADINGFRFVLPHEGEQGLWTATIRAAASGRNEAWVYRSTEGTLSAAALSSNHYVRCIGTPSR